MMKDVPTYNHSPKALAIAKQLVIGKLELEPSLKDSPMKVAEATHVNNTTTTFKFQHVDNLISKGLKKWYNNIDMIGRHFVVYSETHPEIKRHYTVCNTMQPRTLKALESLAESIVKPMTSLNEDDELFDDAFNNSDQSSTSLTIKNYGMPRGVSTWIHKAQHKEYLLGD